MTHHLKNTFLQLPLFILEQLPPNGHLFSRAPLAATMGLFSQTNGPFRPGYVCFVLLILCQNISSSFLKICFPKNFTNQFGYPFENPFKNPFSKVFLNFTRVCHQELKQLLEKGGIYHPFL